MSTALASSPAKSNEAYYFFRLRDNEVVREFCVANARDPNQTVHSTSPDGTKQFWDKRRDGELLVFHPPDGYQEFTGLHWYYDRRLQEGVAAPRDIMERLALNNRVSVCRSI